MSTAGRDASREPLPAGLSTSSGREGAWASCCRCAARRRLTVAGCTRNTRAASTWDCSPACTMSTIAACCWGRSLDRRPPIRPGCARGSWPIRTPQSCPPSASASGPRGWSCQSLRSGCERRPPRMRRVPSDGGDPSASGTSGPVSRRLPYRRGATDRGGGAVGGRFCKIEGREPLQDVCHRPQDVAVPRDPFMA